MKSFKILATLALAGIINSSECDAGPRHPRLETMKGYVSGLVMDSSSLKTKEDIIKIIETLNNPQDNIYTILDTVDGDTVVIYYYNEFITCRLIGVDTPETKDPRKEIQFYGPEASNFTKKTLKGNKVRLEFERYPDGSIKRDNKGRLLVYIFLKDGTFFNLKLIEQGYAKEYTYDKEGYIYQDKFKKAEKKPRQDCLGLWEKECMKNMNN